MPQPSPRTTEIPVHPQFLDRWSPRSFSSEPVPPETLASLFEAARWAPSCFNAQPWLFVHASTAGGRARVLDLLVEANQAWAKQAPVLGILFARRAFEHNGQPNRWGAFDAGAAALAMSLQARGLGLAPHLRGGFGAERAAVALGVPPQDFEAMAAFAIGQRGDRGALPAELAEREGPSSRNPLSEIARGLD
ncbi:MAG: nitroreductase family protein [Planctomycetes bacterium]|nr:nitroreductase family protein [Planctomycetota bacterium]